MQKYFSENENTFENQDDKKVQEYINKYLKELQRHFDMPDKKMRLILYRIYKELSPLHFFKVFVKKYLDMLKSFCKDKIKRY